MKKSGLLIGALALCLAVSAAGCSKKEAGSTTAGAAAPAAVVKESWAIAKDFETDQSKLPDYQGKTFGVKNVVAYAVYPEEGRIEGFAFDPQTNTLTETSPSLIKGKEVKTAESFFINVAFADKADAAKIQESKKGKIGEADATDYQDVLEITGTFDKVEGNTVSFKDAKLIAR